MNCLIEQQYIHIINGWWDTNCDTEYGLEAYLAATLDLKIGL